MRAAHWQAKGRSAAAAAEFAECVRCFRREGSPGAPVDDNNLAYLLLRSANNLVALGSFDEALRQAEEVSELFAAHGAVMGEARALQSIGIIRQTQGAQEEAEARLPDAIATFERDACRSHQANTLAKLASSSDAMDDAVTSHRK
ncbi:hypothetical protein SAMN05421507_13716 [Lentzea jiangxiensis]|uniref:Tetratricopeptide repeat-containing protein n=1 Tax=Lentzea jiangxiensis TaxID=641025 RepID=A0A1H0X5M3_9PSEU|nr:hypothetical protein SAMN05421507_13716 [Lentzea jiangxiensis]